MGKPKKKRGPRPRLRPVDPDSRPRVDMKLFRELIARSKLEPLVARELFAEAVVGLRAVIADFRERQETQPLTGDEARALTSATSGLRRHLAELGFRALPRTEDEEDDDEDPFGIGAPKAQASLRTSKGATS